MINLSLNTLKSIILIGLSGLSNAIFAEAVFRWVDTSGHVHYSDRPPQETIKEIQEKHITQSMIQTSGDGYAMQVATRKFPATFYSSGDCGEICANAKALLDSRNVQYKTIDTNSQGEQLIKITGNTKVPVLTLGASIIMRGWDESRWTSALDEAGYPKHSIKPLNTNKIAPPSTKPVSNVSPQSAINTTNMSRNNPQDTSTAIKN